MAVVGLDIGGANLKAAHENGECVSSAFPLWKSPQELPERLTALLRRMPSWEALAVTTTAELADCFRTKEEGIQCILRAVEQVAPGKPIHVWQTGAEFVSPEIAREIPLLVSAANWHALATWLGRMVPEGNALLIDIGSTTTDMIPLLHGTPIPQGMTDVERLLAGELLYTGIWRTPLCALAHSVPFRGGYCPLAAELFATTADIYLLLELIPEEPDNCATANGRPATREEAHHRLARMLCCDHRECPLQEVLLVAEFLADVQRQRIRGGLQRVLGDLNSRAEQTGCQSVLISGSGSFLAQTLVGSHPELTHAEIIILADVMSPKAAETACALAVARLAAERC